MSSLETTRLPRALVLGGARSGKSTYAERLATEHGGDVVYLATALPDDDEMRERIAHHRARRPAGWRTLEEPLAPSRALAELEPPAGIAIVEDLTLLLSNHRGQADAPSMAVAEELVWNEIQGLLALPCGIILVSNEVGMGIVPDWSLGRLFRDAQGRVNQWAAAVCTDVYFVVAGIAIRVKGGGAASDQPA